MNSSHVKIFWGFENILRYFKGAKTNYDILAVRKHNKIISGCEPLQRLVTTGLSLS